MENLNRVMINIYIKKSVVRKIFGVTKKADPLDWTLLKSFEFGDLFLNPDAGYKFEMIDPSVESISELKTLIFEGLNNLGFNQNVQRPEKIAHGYFCHHPSGHIHPFNIFTENGFVQDGDFYFDLYF